MNKDVFKKRLEAHIEFENKSEHPDDPDATSWGQQEGVLISTNEAKYVLELMKKEK